MCRNRTAIFLIAFSLGFATFPNLAISFFFKDVLKLNPAKVQFCNSILNFIWLLKPLFGFIVDSYSICGSYRRSYLILFSITGALGWIVMGLFVQDLASAMIVKTIINISTSFCNVIGEGIMVEMSQKHAKAKA